MKIYGYSKSNEDLQELSELTFQASASSLREIAKFLEAMADSMESDGENFGHGHAKDFCANWLEENPEIIVFKPNS